LSYKKIQIAIYLYIEYLDICGVITENLKEELEDLRDMIVDKTMSTFNQLVLDDINCVIDKIITKTLLYQ
jgi:hypothetical protein